MATRYKPTNLRDSGDSSPSRVQDDAGLQFQTYTISNLGKLPDDQQSDATDQSHKSSSTTSSARKASPMLSKGSLFHYNGVHRGEVDRDRDVDSSTTSGLDQYADKSATSLRNMVSQPARDAAGSLSSLSSAPVFGSSTQERTEGSPFRSKQPTGSISSSPFRPPTVPMAKPFISPRKLGKATSAPAVEDTIKSIDSNALFRSPRRGSSDGVDAITAQIAADNIPDSMIRSAMKPVSATSSPLTPRQVGSMPAVSPRLTQSEVKPAPSSSRSFYHQRTGSASSMNSAPESRMDASAPHRQSPASNAAPGQLSPSGSVVSCNSPAAPTGATVGRAAAAPHSTASEATASQPAPTTVTPQVSSSTGPSPAALPSLEQQQQQQQMMLSLQNLQQLQLMNPMMNPLLGSLAAPQGLTPASLAHSMTPQQQAQAGLTPQQLQALSAQQLALAQLANPLAFNPMAGLQLLQQQAARMLAGMGPANMGMGPMPGPMPGTPSAGGSVAGDFVVSTPTHPPATPPHYGNPLPLQAPPTGSLLPAFNAAALISGGSGSAAGAGAGQTAGNETVAAPGGLLALTQGGEGEKAAGELETATSLGTTISSAAGTATAAAAAEVTELKQQLQQMEASKQELAESLKQAEASKVEAESKLKRVEVARDELASELRQQLKDAEAARDELALELKQQLKRLEDSRDELEKESGNFKAMSLKLEASLNSKDRSMKAVEEENQALKAKCNELEALNRKLSSNSTPSKPQEGWSQEEAARAKDLASKQEKEIAKLKAMLANEQEEMDSLREFAQLEEQMLRERVKELEGRLSSDRDRQVQELQKQVTELRQKLDAANAAASSLSSQLGQLQDENEAQQSHILRMEAECRRLEDHGLKSDRELAATKRELNNLRDWVSQHQPDLAPRNGMSPGNGQPPSPAASTTAGSMNGSAAMFGSGAVGSMAGQPAGPSARGSHSQPPSPLGGGGGNAFFGSASGNGSGSGSGSGSGLHLNLSSVSGSRGAAAGPSTGGRGVSPAGLGVAVEQPGSPMSPMSPMLSPLRMGASRIPTSPMTLAGAGKLDVPRNDRYPSPRSASPLSDNTSFASNTNSLSPSLTPRPVSPPPGAPSTARATPRSPRSSKLLTTPFLSRPQSPKHLPTSAMQPGFTGSRAPHNAQSQSRPRDNLLGQADGPLTAGRMNSPRTLPFGVNSPRALKSARGGGVNSPRALNSPRARSSLLTTPSYGSSGTEGTVQVKGVVSGLMGMLSPKVRR